MAHKYIHIIIAKHIRARIHTNHTQLANQPHMHKSEDIDAQPATRSMIQNQTQLQLHKVIQSQSLSQKQTDEYTTNQKRTKKLVHDNAQQMQSKNKTHNGITRTHIQKLMQPIAKTKTNQLYIADIGEW